MNQSIKILCLTFSLGLASVASAAPWTSTFSNFSFSGFCNSLPSWLSSPRSPSYSGSYAATGLLSSNSTSAHANTAGQSYTWGDITKGCLAVYGCLVVSSYFRQNTKRARYLAESRAQEIAVHGEKAWDQNPYNPESKNYYFKKS